MNDSREGRLYSSSSYIDIATNFAHLDALDLSSELADFINGDLRASHLLTLLHETAHHWCLTTLVGNALSAYTYRVYETAAVVSSGKELSQDQHDQFLQDIFISRTITAFLKPLLEGLALHAEWRAHPTGDFVFSRPFDIFHQFCGNPELDTDTTSLMKHFKSVSFENGYPNLEVIKAVSAWSTTPDGAKFNAKVQNFYLLARLSLRSSKWELNRKKKIFSEPLDSRKSPYQLGYLFVCGLQKIAFQYHNSDRFLAFLRDYFFNDLILANIILDESISFFDKYSQVRKRLQDRVNNLIVNRESIEDRILTWEAGVPLTSHFVGSAQEIFSGSQYPDAYFDYDHNAASILAVEFERKLSEFCARGNSNIADPSGIEHFLKYGRRIMPLGSAVFEVTDVNEKTIRLGSGAHSEIIIDRNALNIEVKKEHSITVEVLVNVANPGSALVFSKDGKVDILPLGTPTPLTDEQKKIYEIFLAYTPQVRRVVEIGQTFFDKILIRVEGELEPVDTSAIMMMNEDSFQKDVEQIYRNPILYAFNREKPYISNSRWRENAFKLWGAHGILSILEYNNSDLDEFVTLSSTSIEPHYDVDLEKAKSLGLSEDQTADALFFALYGRTRAQHNAIAEKFCSRFAERGFDVFGETSTNTVLSLI